MGLLEHNGTRLTNLHSTAATVFARQRPFSSLKPCSSASRFSRIQSANSKLEYLPTLSRKANDPWPPFFGKATGLTQIGEGHWCLRQDLWLSENIFINTHIIRLRNGDYMMISPPACTEEARALLDSLPGGGGRRVAHVVAPNLLPEHWYCAGEWGAVCSPGATLWTTPGLLQLRGAASILEGPERVRRMKDAYSSILELPYDGPLPGLEEVEVATLLEPTGTLTECTLWLRDYRAAVFMDAAFAAIEHPPGPLPGESAGKRVAGIYRKLGSPFVYLSFRTNPAAARPWLNRVLSWKVEVVLAAHLDPVVADADKELRQCFDFVLQAQPKQ